MGIRWGERLGVGVGVGVGGERGWTRVGLCLGHRAAGRDGIATLWQRNVGTPAKTKKLD